MAEEFDVAGLKIKVSRISAMKQYHIIRRLAPIMADLVPLATKFQNMTDSELSKDQSEAIAPILTGIGKMSDADSEYVLYGLLDACEVRQPEVGNWARMIQGGVLMFQDLPITTLFQVAAVAFKVNLQGFISALPQGNSRAKANQPPG